MAAESLVEQLLDEISDSGRTPEEVCGAYPELLPEVRRRWRQMCAIEAELDAFFPVPGTAPTPIPHPRRHADAELPRIPGYDVEALLGRGGMGVVYKARHRRLDRPVALKMLLAGGYAGPAERARFQREAEAVAGLRHPNIVAVYDVGDHGRPAVLHDGVPRRRQPRREARRHAAAGPPGGRAAGARWPRPCRSRTRAGSSTAT